MSNKKEMERNDLHGSFSEEFVSLDARKHKVTLNVDKFLKSKSDEAMKMLEESSSSLEYFDSLDYASIKKSPSDLDRWDYATALGLGLSMALLTTSESIKKWFEGIHDCASGNPNKPDAIQKLFGALLYHSDDSIDKSIQLTDNPAIDSVREDFHRLIFGHDIAGLPSNNPFFVMTKQKGIFGIVQVFRHLVGDTCSKQGLPLPGSSLFNYCLEKNGKTQMTNYLLNVVRGLHGETKVDNQTIYSNILAIHATDVIAGGIISTLSPLYFVIRGIEDEIRQTQFRLLANATCFFAKAIIGAIKHKGIPSINYPVAIATLQNVGYLLWLSNKETNALLEQTNQLIEDSETLIKDVDKTNQLLGTVSINLKDLKEN